MCGEPKTTEEKMQAARAMLNENGLSNWALVLERNIFAAGVTYHEQREIHLSVEVAELNDWAHFRRAVIHEMAHALSPDVVAEQNEDPTGHTSQWRLRAIELGDPNPAEVAEDTDLNLPLSTEQFETDPKVQIDFLFYRLYTMTHGAPDPNREVARYLTPEWGAGQIGE
jgi:hypothetical protein